MKTVLLIGLGRFGKRIAQQLSRLGYDITAVDKNEERIADVIDIVAAVQVGDSTNIEFLQSLDVDNYDLCIVALGSDFQSTLAATHCLKELGARQVISQARRDGQAKFLIRNGADGTMYPEKQAARWADVRYDSDYIIDLAEIDDEYSIFEVIVPKSWQKMTVSQIDCRGKYSISILAVKQNGRMNMQVTPDTILTSDKTLLVTGEHKVLMEHFNV